ncbi:tumor suppressor candidate 2 [Rhinoderma darwinii]|uniref:tumor suppressor candidate 2 n=1 Tax=Rhinoderma darwinii TaxID=43563 RepID=UPI003F66F767
MSPQSVAPAFLLLSGSVLYNQSFSACSSMYFDEDGDLAHEFYEETIVTKNGRKRAKLKRVQKNLRPQGNIKLDHPCIHVDFPVVLCEV